MRVLGGHGLVLGASMGGLMAARVLSDSYQRVTSVERDQLLSPVVEISTGSRWPSSSAAWWSPSAHRCSARRARHIPRSATPAATPRGTSTSATRPTGRCARSPTPRHASRSRCCASSRSSTGTRSKRVSKGCSSCCAARTRCTRTGSNARPPGTGYIMLTRSIHARHGVHSRFAWGGGLTALGSIRSVESLCRHPHRYPQLCVIRGRRALRQERRHRADLRSAGRA